MSVNPLNLVSGLSAETRLVTEETAVITDKVGVVGTVTLTRKILYLVPMNKYLLEEVLLPGQYFMHNTGLVPISGMLLVRLIGEKLAPSFAEKYMPTALKVLLLFSGIKG